MDFGSRSDPFCVLYKFVNQKWQLVGKTEVIHDTLNPKFVKKIMVDFHFERQDNYRVEVYDSDDEVQQV